MSCRGDQVPNSSSQTRHHDTFQSLLIYTYTLPFLNLLKDTRQYLAYHSTLLSGNEEKEETDFSLCLRHPLTSSTPLYRNNTENPDTAVTPPLYNLCAAIH